MKRLIATMRCDVRLQVRNGFYYAAGFVVAGMAALISQLPRFELGWALPGFVLSNLVMSTFYFVGGLVLLEKDEGTLEAQAVTPLRAWQYLASKVSTLALLALAENLILVALLRGWGFKAVPLVAATLLAAAVYVLAGFWAVARYESINEYLFPSVAYTTVLLAPLVDYFGLWQSAIFYLHPMQATLVLMKAAFEPVSALEIFYGIFYSALWIGLLFALCIRSLKSLL